MVNAVGCFPRMRLKGVVVSLRPDYVYLGFQTSCSCGGSRTATAVQTFEAGCGNRGLGSEIRLCQHLPFTPQDWNIQHDLAEKQLPKVSQGTITQM